MSLRVVAPRGGRVGDPSTPSANRSLSASRIDTQPHVGSQDKDAMRLTLADRNRQLMGAPRTPSIQSP
jgi:hypothetical protein